MLILKMKVKPYDALTDIYEEIGYYRDQPISKIFEGQKVNKRLQR